MDPRSFSEAFLLSMNCPSGMALALSTLYLWEEVEYEEGQIPESSIKPVPTDAIVKIL